MLSLLMMRIEKIAIVSHDQVLYLNVYDIVYFESKRDVVEVHFIDGSSINIYKQLSKLQMLLPQFFVRVTQCVIINKFYLGSIDKKEKVIRLQGNAAISYTMPLGKLIQRIGRISSSEAGFLARVEQENENESLLEIA